MVERERTWLRRALRWGVVLAALGAGALAVSRDRDSLAAALHRLSAGALALSAVTLTIGIVFTMFAWRALLGDLGSPLPLPIAGRIFFLAQLGKYLPGSVWPVLAQMELGREHHVPPRRSAAVALLSLAFSLVSGLLVAAVGLPSAAPDALEQYWWAFVAVPALLVGLHPRVLGAVFGVAFRLLRRPPLEQPPTAGGAATAIGWLLLSWLLFGLHLAILLNSLGAAGPRVFLAAIGAFALAWSVGFLVVVAPAGAGVREAVLVVTLAPVAAQSTALLAALVSRVLFTVIDVSAAGIAVLLERRRRRAPTPTTPT